MNVANIISVIGNNSSVTPILVKDGIESSFKVYLADEQGKKISKEQGFYEAREAAIEEFGTTAIWFGVPIVVTKAFNAIGKKVLGLKDDKLLKVDSQLLNGKNYQTLEKNLQHTGDEFIKSDAEKTPASKLSKLLHGRRLLGVGITIGLLAALTLFKQKVTENSIEKHGSNGLAFAGENGNTANHSSTPQPKNKTSNQPSFKGVGELVAQASIDAGVGAVRIGTARDKDEKKEYVFKTITFIAMSYLGGPIVEKGLNAIAKVFNLPMDLDAKVIADKNFTAAVVAASKSKEAKDKMLAFAQIDTNATPLEKEETIIKFIDEELKNAKFDAKGNFQEFNNATLEAARKSGVISIENNKRAVTKFINTEKVQNIHGHIQELIEITTKKGSSLDFIKKVKATKYGTVLANIGICSAIIGIALPKIQYIFREKGIGTIASPGVKASNKHHKKTA